MVKNSIGGNKAKRQGRKFVGTVSSKLRVSMEDGEIYAVVTKLLGNAMIDVLCIDGTQRICIIRNKFRGRGKRDNCVAIGTWLLIGKRDWEIVDGNKKEKCDLLEVYTLNDVEQLKKLPNNWKVLTSVTEKEEPQDDTVLFTDKAMDYPAYGDDDAVDFSGNNLGVGADVGADVGLGHGLGHGAGDDDDDDGVGDIDFDDI